MVTLGIKVNTELREMLYEQVSSRDHIVQYEMTTGEARKLVSWYLISRDIQGMIDCMTMAAALGKLKQTKCISDHRDMGENADYLRQGLFSIERRIFQPECEMGRG